MKKYQRLPGAGVKLGKPLLDPTGAITPADPAGAGVKIFSRGHDPGGVGVEEYFRGLDPGGAGAEK